MQQSGLQGLDAGEFCFSARAYVPAVQLADGPGIKNASRCNQFDPKSDSDVRTAGIRILSQPLLSAMAVAHALYRNHPAALPFKTAPVRAGGFFIR